MAGDIWEREQENLLYLPPLFPVQFRLPFVSILFRSQICGKEREKENETREAASVSVPSDSSLLKIGD